ncbi:hypothetical protein KKH23_09175 [Patescibacteria group bacterium]|nr:hypothetical protein [Patescibacteria group bacterium]
MIPIKIFYDRDKTHEVNDKIWQRWSGREKKWAEHGYNVSECSGCELKCFCNRTGMEQKITRKSIGFLVFGIIAETIVMEIYPEDQRQCEANLNEIVWGHMDAYENLTYPIEGKATAKRIFKAKDLPVVWVMQLINYITMSKSNKGWLYILDIFTRTFSAFCVELTSNEKLQQIEELMDKVSRFDKAIQTKDPSNLRINPEQHELCNYKGTCPRRQECKEKYKETKKKK